MFSLAPVRRVLVIVPAMTERKTKLQGYYTYGTMLQYAKESCFQCSF